MELVHFTSKAIVELQSSFSLAIVTTQVLEKPTMRRKLEKLDRGWRSVDTSDYARDTDTLLSLGV